MTQDLFRSDAYLTECQASVMAVTDQGIVLDRTVFYPMGGGQAGDAGVLVLADGRELPIAELWQTSNGSRYLRTRTVELYWQAASGQFKNGNARAALTLTQLGLRIAPRNTGMFRLQREICDANPGLCEQR